MRAMSEKWHHSLQLGRRIRDEASKARLVAVAAPLVARAGRRMAARRDALALLAVVLGLLIALAGLSVFAALTASVAALGAVAVWPGDEDRRSARTLGAASPADGSRPGRWRALVDAIPDAAVALAADGTVMHANPSMREIFPRLAHGKPLTLVTRNPELMAALDAALAGSPASTVEMTERVPLERHLSVTVSGLLGGAGADEGWPETPALLVTFRDQTEQDRLARMRADFIANASHELRTPLAALRGFVETLQGPARDDVKTRDRFLVLMQAQAARMTRLIDDLLSLSRIEMRAHLPPRGVADLVEIGSHVMQTVEPLAREAKAVVTLDASVAAARIRGDRDEIVQALLNLVQNALKYGREGGRVTIRVARLPAADGKPARIEVAVADDGPGIAPEHLPRLTERFYRVNDRASRDKGGTGLGLAIVKHIVVHHRGELRIDSRLGEGSTFVIAFDALGV